MSTANDCRISYECPYMGTGYFLGIHPIFCVPGFTKDAELAARFERRTEALFMIHFLSTHPSIDPEHLYVYEPSRENVD